MQLSDFIPASLLLSRVQTQKVFCDRTSIDRHTHQRKTKYKVAGNILAPLKVYAFFVATSQRDACKKNSTVVVEPQHWENVVGTHLRAPFTYLDVRKVEPLSDQELAQKMRDPANRFSCVARLCDAKYQELKGLRSSVHTHHAYLPVDQIVLIKAALDDVFVDTSKISDDILQKLGL